jgi:hypothetical protein
MNPSQKTGARGVAGVHLATSAQPPRATSVFPSWFPSSISAQPIPPSFALRTNGTRQESLGCCGFPPAPLEEMGLHKPNQIFSRE